jgi:ATP-dependent RNA helicase RhlE
LTAFTDLGLGAPLLRALDEERYRTPTPIQAKAIPGVLAGRDLLGIAQTGTGKTAAFALPILERLAASRRPAPRRGCRALVLSPTRELATQIGDSFRTYGRHLGMTVTVVFGGVGHRQQVQALARGVDVLVATPGRLLDHMGAGDADLRGAEIFVLDEADQMLDLGFVKPIRQIVRHLSARRQSLFFSATMPPEIGRLADELLTSPLKVSVAPAATTVERVAQRVIHVAQNRKRAVLVALLADAAMQRTLVFTRTKRGADRVARHLEEAAIAVAAIHGNKSQNQREAALEDFRTGRIRVLVATDIAARGIDIDHVTHVVNFELPDVPESYVHRIGRTARAGAAGVAISLVDGEERVQLRDIERVTRQSIASEDRRHDESLVADRSRDGDRRGASRPCGRDLVRRPREETRGRHGPRGERRAEADRGGGERQDGKTRHAQAGARGGLHMPSRSDGHRQGHRRPNLGGTASPRRKPDEHRSGDRPPRGRRQP